MNYTDFTIRLLTALALGGVIGLERQWRQRTTGLRTNSLVAMGSAMFVMMGVLIGGPDSQSRVASYVVSGIGFLGGGVILRDGLSVRGLNTAATLWCTAAVGTLAGCGFLMFSAAGTMGVLVTNLVLRPLAYRINRVSTETESEQQEILYRFRCTCRAQEEAHIRALLLQNVGRTPLALLALQSKDHETGDRVDVQADMKVVGRKDEYLEQIVTRLSLESSVTAISWKVISALDAEEEATGYITGNLAEAKMD
jgi:putative Mg2+ transporter-C (MgtC) family protein